MDIPTSSLAIALMVAAAALFVALVEHAMNASDDEDRHDE